MTSMRETRLGTCRVLSYFDGVSFFLRILGILNTAVWFGTAVFFTVAVWPGFASAEMLRILPLSHSGAAAQVILERYCWVQYWCGAIALTHLTLEWLYAGKSLQRWIVYGMTGLLGLGLFTGLVLEPKLSRRHLEFYGLRSTPQQREEAGKSLRVLQGLVQVTNVLTMLGLGICIWEISSSGTGPRFARRAPAEGLTNRVW
jgi:hypothetical protein